MQAAPAPINMREASMTHGRISFRSSSEDASSRVLSVLSMLKDAPQAPPSPAKAKTRRSSSDRVTLHRTL